MGIWMGGVYFGEELRNMLRRSDDDHSEDNRRGRHEERGGGRKRRVMMRLNLYDDVEQMAAAESYASLVNNKDGIRRDIGEEMEIGRSSSTGQFYAC